MKQSFINKDGNHALVMFFAGWGVDSTTFAGLRRKGFDIMVLWDYRDLSIDITMLDSYDEIVVLAWSLGIPAAYDFIRENINHITKSIAVAGSPYPISVEYGIDPTIYQKTAELPDERSLQKFYMRICGGKRGMERMMPTRPERTLDELRAELEIIASRKYNTPSSAEARYWDEVYICLNDKIFPAANLRKTWENLSGSIKMIEEEHFPDFNKILEKSLIDKSLARERFATASVTYSSNAHVQQTVAETLVRKALGTGFKPTSADVLEIGSGTGLLTHLYLPYFSKSRFTLLDLSNEPDIPISDNEISVKQCDAELEIRKMASESVDVVFSASTFQWLHSPVKALAEIHRILRRGGRAFISYFGNETLKELNEYIQPLPYPSIGEATLREIGFEAAIVSERLVDKFADARSALLNLRQTGVNAVSAEPLSAGTTRQLMRSITQPDGSVALTYQPIYLILKKL